MKKAGDVATRAPGPRVPIEPSVDAPRAGAEADASTRHRVVQSILEHGPSTAAVLGERLGLTAAAVRRHLDGLLERGVLTAREHAGRQGADLQARRPLVRDPSSRIVTAAGTVVGHRGRQSVRRQ